MCACMYNTLFYILKCFMPYYFLPFFSTLTPKVWKKSFPIITKFYFGFIIIYTKTQIEYTSAVFKFTIQWTETIFTHTPKPKYYTLLRIV